MLIRTVNPLDRVQLEWNSTIDRWSRTGLQYQVEWNANICVPLPFHEWNNNRSVVSFGPRASEKSLGRDVTLDTLRSVGSN
jgi:hypothetical protein